MIIQTHNQEVSCGLSNLQNDTYQGTRKRPTGSGSNGFSACSSWSTTNSYSQTTMPRNNNKRLSSVNARVRAWHLTKDSPRHCTGETGCAAQKNSECQKQKFQSQSMCEGNIQKSQFTRARQWVAKVHNNVMSCCWLLLRKTCRTTRKRK